MPVMVLRVRLISSLVLAVGAAFFVAACGKSTPTTPSATAPRIDSISPSAIQPDPSPQAITFVGINFQPNLSLFVTAPDNSLTTLAGSDIPAVQSQSFQTNVTFGQTGSYSFVVQNPSGERSSAFTVMVQNGGGPTAPTITSISPNSLPTTSLPTPMIIQGANFAQNASVTIVDPAGTSTGIPTQGLTNTTSSTIQLSFVFNQRGVYTVFVVNPNGAASNTVLITTT